MRFTSAIVAAVALASSALAQTAGFAVMTSPTQDQQIPAGSSFELIWNAGTPTGDVSIVLLQGETAATLQLGATLATAIPSTEGRFAYTIPSTSSFKTYGFKITLNSNPAVFQYSFPFHISGSTVSSASSASSASSVTSAESSSASGHVIGVTTHIAVPTTVINSTTVTSTVCTKCQHKATSAAIVYSNSTSAAAPVSTPYSNSTTFLSSKTLSSQTLLSKTLHASSAASASATSASTASSTPVLVTTNGAAAKVASAGLALGGMLMAFAL